MKLSARFFPVRTALLAAGLVTITAAAAFPALAQDPVQSQGPNTEQGEDLWRPGWMMGPMWQEPDAAPDIRARMRRHQTFMHAGVPEAYRDAQSTVDLSPETIEAGRALYDANCASCHGKDGLGDGDSARGLSPSPALLAYMIQRPMAIDEYLLWTIADGGKAFGTAMPAFGGSLSRMEIWRIVAYMRAGFPR